MTTVVQSVADVRTLRWQDPTLTWGLVPTMGALHRGHLALVQQALAENDRVGVSIFVNPTQFNRPDDLAKYPRQLEQDVAMLGDLGVHVVWAPLAEEVYLADHQTTVSVQAITQPLEGAHRPGHFAGVTTIVAKLFNVFQPTRAYFGQKDAQQVAVIRQMVRDLNFNLTVITCPTVREADGLAMSSRNQLLSSTERQAAPILYRALTAAQAQWQQGHHDPDRLRELMLELLASEPLARVDYVSVADPMTLQELTTIAPTALLSMAVYIGNVRLIDNITLS